MADISCDLRDINFLYCNHPLYPCKVDEGYEEEYQEAGLNHACALFSYENLEMGKLSLYGEEISGLTIYRGWMMTPELYGNLYSKLGKKGVILINTPEEYEKYHLLPGWYEDFKDVTPETVWETEGKLENLFPLTKGLEGAYIVKDFVKSRKHEWYDACYIPNISDKSHASKIIRTFINRQEDSLVGGVVLRKFENLKQIGYHERSGMPLSEEYRAFILAGKILAVDDYWTNKADVDISEEERIWVESIAQKVKSNFVTVDLARREDGTLIIMEFGDGQVSGLQQIKADVFYRGFEPDSIPVEDFFPEGAVVIASDPMPNKTVEEMQKDISAIDSIPELVEAYVQVHNKFWFIEDNLYDYGEGAEEYMAARDVVDGWGEMMNSLDARVMQEAEKEGLLAEKQPDSGNVKRLEAFMNKYGYRDGGGWWVKNKDC